MDLNTTPTEETRPQRERKPVKRFGIDEWVENHR